MELHGLADKASAVTAANMISIPLKGGLLGPIVADKLIDHAKEQAGFKEPMLKWTRVKEWSRTVNLNTLRFTLLAALFVLAVSPVFRADSISKYLEFIGSSLLTILAGWRLFKRFQ